MTKTHDESRVFLFQKLKIDNIYLSVIIVTGLLWFWWIRRQCMNSNENLVKGEKAMNEVSRGQALQVCARVGTQIRWDELDGKKLQSEVISLSADEFGRRFTNFLKNGAQVSRAKSPNMFTVISNGVPYCEVPKHLKGKGYFLDQQAKNFFERLSSPIDVFGTLPTAMVTNGVTYLLGIIYGSEFNDNERTLLNVQREALNRGWWKTPVETAYLTRLKFRHSCLNKLGIGSLWIMHEPVLNSKFDVLILGGDKYGGLYAGNTVPSQDLILHSINSFAFLVPQFGE